MACPMDGIDGEGAAMVDGPEVAEASDIAGIIGSDAMLKVESV